MIVEPKNGAMFKTQTFALAKLENAILSDINGITLIDKLETRNRVDGVYNAVLVAPKSQYMSSKAFCEYVTQRNTPESSGISFSTPERMTRHNRIPSAIRETYKNVTLYRTRVMTRGISFQLYLGAQKQ